MCETHLDPEQKLDLTVPLNVGPLVQEGGLADAKRKRVSPDDAQRGAAAARAFLRDFKALPMDRMDGPEALEQAQALMRQLESDAAGIPSLQACTLDFKA